MTFRRGAVISFMKKQKINAKSSTEAELIEVDDALPQMLWVHYFIEEHGYKVQRNKLKQDNMSAIRLEQNGQAFSSKQTKHICVRYFYQGQG